MLKIAFMLCGTVLAVREKDNNLDVKARKLPCSLTVEHGKSVRKGESETVDSFAIMLTCSEKVSDGRLMVPWLFKEGTFPTNIRGKDGTDQLQADESIQVWSSPMVKKNPYYEVYGVETKDQEMLSYLGSTFTFTAKFGDEEATDEVSVVITEAPETTTQPTVTLAPMTGGDLPCVLKVEVPPQSKNADIKLRCTEAVTKVRLITPPSYNDYAFNDMQADKTFTLTTLQMIPALTGKTFVVEGISSQSPEPTQSNVVVFPAPPGSGDTTQVEEKQSKKSLPCEIRSSNVDLSGTTAPGFSISMTCTEKITDVHLKIPGYADRTLNPLEPGKEWVLATYQKQEMFKGKAFFVEATYEGKTGVSESVFQPE